MKRKYLLIGVALATFLLSYSLDANSGRTVTIRNDTSYSIDVYVEGKKATTLREAASAPAQFEIRRKWIDDTPIAYFGIARNENGTIAGVYSGFHKGLNLNVSSLEVAETVTVTDKDLIR